MKQENPYTYQHPSQAHYSLNWSQQFWCFLCPYTYISPSQLSSFLLHAASLKQKITTQYLYALRANCTRDFITLCHPLRPQWWIISVYGTYHTDLLSLSQPDDPINLAVFWDFILNTKNNTFLAVTCYCFHMADSEETPTCFLL
jgi:hypothetical protein